MESVMDMDGLAKAIYIIDQDGTNKEPLIKLTFEFSPGLGEREFGMCQDIFYKAFEDMRKQFNID